MICYQKQRHGNAAIFILKKDLLDSKKLTGLISKIGLASFYTYILPLDDEQTFNTLASKTAYSFAYKNGKWIDDVEDWEYDLDRIKRYYYNSGKGYTMLPWHNVEPAIRDVPKQNSTKHKDWCCGPNTGLRALHLLGEHGYKNYVDFVESCPRLTEPFDYLTFGYLRVGPSPNQLAKFLNRKLDFDSYEVKVENMCDDIITSSIDGRILSDWLAKIFNRKLTTSIDEASFHEVKNCPVIALIVEGTFSMHYINIIGYSKDHYVVLDTDGAVGHIKKSKLVHWLDRDGYAYFMLANRYTIISFAELSEAQKEQKARCHINESFMALERNMQASREAAQRDTLRMQRMINGEEGCLKTEISFGGCHIL